MLVQFLRQRSRFILSSDLTIVFAAVSARGMVMKRIGANEIMGKIFAILHSGVFRGGHGPPLGCQDSALSIE